MTKNWNHHDFNKLDWCNSSIHAVRFGSQFENTGAIIFDIDYVLEWDKPQPNAPNYRVASADLIFHDAKNLRISIDCSKILDRSNGNHSHPIRISGIDRQVSADNDQTYSWRISLYDMQGDFHFESPGFRQTLTSDVVNCHSQIKRNLR